MTFTPCSPRHKSCSPAHAALIRGYIEERQRQELALEEQIDGPGERQLWKENGGKLIGFYDWLKAHKHN